MKKRKKANKIQRWIRKIFQKKKNLANRAQRANHARGNFQNYPEHRQAYQGRRKNPSSRKRGFSKGKKSVKRFTIFWALISVILVFALFFGYHAYKDRQNYLQKIAEQKQAQEEKAKESARLQKEFLDRVKIEAAKCKTGFGIFPSIAAAQAILESNWGTSELSRKYNNYFGIKSLKESDQRVVLPTYEYYNGKKTRVDEPFRAYDSMAASFLHYGKLLSEAKIYKKVIAAKTYEEAAQALYDAGYSTDPNYPAKLIDLIRSEKLYELD